ncbi:GIY-YIG nuclease family protein [Roseobacter sp.]|uniref:GIY-YIG nuclease family protein n=1 Tax=Roseobacter sp. TaxID=1907202 RepID=UPI00398FBB80
MNEGNGGRTCSDLTHSLTVAAKALLSPENLVLPNDVLDHIKERSTTHGLYGWWFDGNLPFVPRDGCIAHKGKHLLYVGIAPPKDGPARSRSSTPMKRRLWRNHVIGTVRSSTLRLSLAALLQHDLNLAFWRDARNRVRMDRV